VIGTVIRITESTLGGSLWKSGLLRDDETLEGLGVVIWRAVRGFAEGVLSGEAGERGGPGWLEKLHNCFGNATAHPGRRVVTIHTTLWLLQRLETRASIAPKC